jgi:hypothetical protein
MSATAASASREQIARHHQSDRHQRDDNENISFHISTRFLCLFA